MPLADPQPRGLSIFLSVTATWFHNEKEFNNKFTIQYSRPTYKQSCKQAMQNWNYTQQASY